MKKLLFGKSIALAFFAVASLGANAQELSGTTKIDPIQDKFKVQAQEVMTLFQSDPDKGNKAYNKLIKALGSNVGQLISVSDFFSASNFPMGAKMVAQAAYEKDPKNVNAVLNYADVSQGIRQWGRSAQLYDEALEIEPENIYALTQAARMYKHSNPERQMEVLTKLKELDPSSAYVARNLGDNLYNEAEKLSQEDKADEAKNKFAEAAKEYKKYYAVEKHNADDLEELSCECYCVALYNSGQFAELIPVATELATIYPKAISFHRLAFYAMMQKYEPPYEESVLAQMKTASAYLTSDQFKKDDYNYSDYFFGAEYESAAKNYEQAIAYTRLALEKDSSNKVLYSNIGNYYIFWGDHDAEALAAFKEYEQKADEMTLDHYLYIGGVAIDAMNKAADDEQKRAFRKDVNYFLNKAKDLTDESTAYRIPLLRAQKVPMESADEVNELKFSYLQQMFDALPADGSKDAEVLGEIQYLMYCTAQTEAAADEPDFKPLRTMCDRVLKVDPENEMAKNFDGVLKSIGL